ncbi:MAG: response regulator [Bdellovibrionales bacterium]|nr:response regulator [Bdellovibrionales bacterium]
MNENAKRRILVVDDEDSIRRVLRATLSSHGYEVREAVNAAEALQFAIEFRPELVILDLGLPDRPGAEVLKSIRGWSSVPILILTAHDSESEKVNALDAGADDYLTKPFSVAELLARLRVAFRHRSGTKDGEPARFGKLEVDLDGHRVRVDGKDVHLTVTEFEILRVLLKFAGKVVTHRNLLKEIWGPNSVEHTQYLRVYVGQLRKKLRVAGDAAERIVTEPGVGYRFEITA